MIKLNKQAIYNKMKQFLISILGDFVVKKHVRL